MTKANKEVRELLKSKKISQWEIAKEMGISEFTHGLRSTSVGRANSMQY